MAELAGNKPKLRLNQYRLVFWDFDGVIKESVNVKADAFYALFQPYGAAVAEQVVTHHLAYGGLSRFKKIENALRQYVGVEPVPDQVRDMANQFGELVREKVVEAAWVPGVESLLRENPFDQIFVLATGTPQEEIEWILGRLGLTDVFQSVYGAPIDKADAVSETLKRFQVSSGECVFFGDSRTDLEAAKACKVPFVLRETTHADAQFADHVGPRIRDFSAVLYARFLDSNV